MAEVGRVAPWVWLTCPPLQRVGKNKIAASLLIRADASVAAAIAAATDDDLHVIA